MSATSSALHAAGVTNGTSGPSLPSQTRSNKCCYLGMASVSVLVGGGGYAVSAFVVGITTITAIGIGILAGFVFFAVSALCVWKFRRIAIGNSSNSSERVDTNPSSLARGAVSVEAEVKAAVGDTLHNRVNGTENPHDAISVDTKVAAESKVRHSHNLRNRQEEFASNYKQLNEFRDATPPNNLCEIRNCLFNMQEAYYAFVELLNSRPHTNEELQRYGWMKTILKENSETYYEKYKIRDRPDSSDTRYSNDPMARLHLLTINTVISVAKAPHEALDKALEALNKQHNEAT